MGIRARFVLIMGFLGVFAIVVIGYASYQFSVKSALDEAKSKGEIIFSYIVSANKFFTDNQRPLIMELVEKDRFYPELMSTFNITREIYENFSKKLPGYNFKMATLNPLQPANKADKDEILLISELDRTQSLARKEGSITKGGVEYYYLAEPVKVETSCLLCHGDPQQAPKDLVDIYGTDHGYQWEVGKVSSALIVYIPTKQAMKTAWENASMLFGIGTGCLLIALLGTWIFLDRSVVTPIVLLSNRTVDISLGKNIEEGIVSKSKDEVGSLAQAIERLRVSIVKMLRRRNNE
jgi:hypothetical protein